MKKLLGIIVVGLLLSGNAYADSDNNLKGIKEFKLLVDHNGCNKQNFENELTTNAKYLISNSKIKLTDSAPETLLLSVFSGDGVESDSEICTSYLKLEVYSLGMVKNSVGYERLAVRVSYKLGAIAWNTGSGYETTHRDRVIRNFDQFIKRFIVDWNEAQN